ERAAGRRADEGGGARADALNGCAGRELLDINTWIRDLYGHSRSSYSKLRSYSPLGEGTSTTRGAAGGGKPGARQLNWYCTGPSSRQMKRPCPSVVVPATGWPPTRSPRTHAPGTGVGLAGLVTASSTCPPICTQISAVSGRSLCRYSITVVVTIGPAISVSRTTGSVATRYSDGFQRWLMPIVPQNSASLGKPSTGSTCTGRSASRMISGVLSSAAEPAG